MNLNELLVFRGSHIGVNASLYNTYTETGCTDDSFRTDLSKLMRRAIRTEHKK